METEVRYYYSINSKDKIMKYLKKIQRVKFSRTLL